MILNYNVNGSRAHSFMIVLFYFKFRYAGCLEKCLMTMSVLLVLVASGVYPFAFIIYANVVNTLVDLQKAAILSGSLLDHQANTTKHMGHVENVSLSDSNEFW